MPNYRHTQRLHLDNLEDRLAPDAKWDLARPHNPDQILVRLKPGTPAPTNPAFTSLGLSNLYAVEVQDGATVEQTLQQYAAKGSILYAEPDYQIFPEATPNDPQFGDGSLWGLHNTGQSGGVVDADIDAPEAWDIAHDAGDVIVAVIDTGIDYNHPDLAANIWTNPKEIPGDNIDNDKNGYIDDVHGYDFLPNPNDPTLHDSDPMDENGHGTHVAGTIGAVGNNGIGVTGVAWNVKLMAVKIFGPSGSTYFSTEISALNYAVKNGARLSNNSYGGYGFSQAHVDAVAAAGKKGMLFVASAGNDANDNDLFTHVPDGYDLSNVVSVASLTRTDTLSSFSNFGGVSVDLGAPGSSIYSTYPTAMGSYATLNGTSMASPHVTGALALLKHQHPTWSNAQLKEHLLATTVPIPALAGKTTSGGRLNLANMLSADPLPRVTGLNPSPNLDGSLGKVRLKFNVPIVASSINPATVKVTGPDGTNLPVLSIKPVGATKREWDVSFPAAKFTNTTGGVRVFVSPTVRGTAGHLDQDGDATGGEPGQDHYIGTTFIVDGPAGGFSDTGTSTFLLPITNTMTIRDVNVQVNLSHPYIGDLVVELVAPSGATVPLTYNLGANGNGLATWFDDEAALRVRQSVAPFKGTFQPTVGLNRLDGLAGNGSWFLRITDSGLGTLGSILSWRLAVTTDTVHAAPTVTSTQFITGDGAWPEGVQVDFNTPIQASSFTSRDVRILGPGNIPVKVLSVLSGAGASSTRFNILTKPILTPGTFKVYLGPALADSWGASLDGDGDFMMSEAADTAVRTLTATETVFQGKGLPVNLNDGTGISTYTPVETIVTMNVTSSKIISNLRVSMDVLHTWDADLRVTLISPKGTEVQLVNQRGGSSDHFRRTVFDDAAATAIGSAAAPFNGTYRPEQLLSAFDGENAKGTWKLKFEDGYAGDAGILLAWALYIQSP